jgi:hypothetical protein
MNRIMLLAISLVAFACYSTASQAAITSLTVTSATVSKSTGATTVSGTLVCTAGDSVEVNTSLIQTNNTRVSQASGRVDLTCSGGTDTWTAPTFFTFGTPIQPGAGVAQAGAVDFNDGTFISPPGKKVEVKPVP